MASCDEELSEGCLLGGVCGGGDLVLGQLLAHPRVRRAEARLVHRLLEHQLDGPGMVAKQKIEIGIEQVVCVRGKYQG